ncbi:N-acetylglucosaminyl deacetylase, LmbE family [Cyclobacterium xiamenense]|uniref:N-acetylglucosaminyl deacetylase, LmbE family n=1 Tax=Cyclobacterium xiamenense TaxID=1297121 RepID=A0A1H6UR19_9BACT|nr:PIG-L family deacetylase [Cyclobacterium xiamenense]SEI90352.1 N-acetylglucosaminyl deacetylase, LmbE family [Cyclobacterium xiamenense]
MIPTPTRYLAPVLSGLLYFMAFLPLVGSVSFAQSSSEIYHELLRLRETKRVLYVAAHPDDENTRLIAYLANGLHAEVGYLSLTRGDGGQNLIGKELGIELGMIRTQELLKARETDGGKQFFSRAIDFGYSRNPDETLSNWDRNKLLSDLVWVIRNFQPDLIITRFNTTPGTTHGHHTTSAILAAEAFERSGQADAFPEQLHEVEPWSAKRIFWNAYSWGSQYEPKPDIPYHTFPVGEYNALLGTSYSQIAADSRTMHKSQGFGSTASIGEGKDFIEFVGGEPFESDPFEGISDRWQQLSEGREILNRIEELLAIFDFATPVNNLPELLEIRTMLNQVQENFPWVSEKQRQVEQLILDVLGWKALFLANKELSFPSDRINARLIVNQPGDERLELDHFEVLGTRYPINAGLSNNQPVEWEQELRIPSTHPVSQPYWLKSPAEDNLYTVAEQNAIGKPFNDPAVSGILRFRLYDQEMEVRLPLQYRYNDQVNGEIIQPFTLVPKISLAVDQENVFLLGQQEARIGVTVSFEGAIEPGVLGIEGLESGDYTVLDSLADPSSNRLFFNVALRNPNGESKSQHTVFYKTREGSVYMQGKKRIVHPHIPNLTYFPEASFNLIRLNMDLRKQTIGYIPGAGDEIPDILRNLGYTVEILESGNLGGSVFGKYTTLIVGIRAFNVNQGLANQTAALMDYVKQGGNLIVQYNTSSPLLSRQLGPYPLELSRDRITVEDSPVSLILKDHPVLTQPNTIEESDFDGWVQERGLYFPGSWDEAYQTPLQMQDPNEPPTKGSLLVARYGEGTYTYSGISWFRLLPAGVPGAIKLFVNLIEQAHE